MKLGMLFIAFSVLSSASFAREVKIEGLKAKALYDTLSSTTELRDFTDSAMGGRWFFAADTVECVKDVTPNKENANCTFSSTLENQIVLKVTLDSNNNEHAEKLESIRFVLNEASKGEKIISETKKELKLKNLSCSSIGNRHVLDDLAIELKYECKMTR